MNRLGTHPSSSEAQDFEFALGDELRGERATKGKTLLDVQRDLRIQASYIAAIEDGNVAAFPNPSFIPGYVRSYARYLMLDPVEVYARFCAENDFSYAAAGADARSGKSANAPDRPGSGLKKRAQAPVAGAAGFQPIFPLAEPEPSLFSEIRLSAVGSLLVLISLVGGLGYGGWTVLQNIQRVQFAPVEDLPVAQSEMAVIEAPDAAPDADELLGDLERPVTATALTELYRQQELEVPILRPRDGPIAAIDPDMAGPLLIHVPKAIEPPPGAVANISDVASIPVAVGPLIEAVYAEEGKRRVIDVAAALADEYVPVSIVAERAAWVRIYQANGTILFERILERGESFTLPRGIEAPRIWAGNSGSLYVEMGSELRGPLGSGTRSIRDVSLEPDALVADFPVVEEVPEVIAQRSGASSGIVTPAVAIQ